MKKSVVWKIALITLIILIVLIILFYSFIYSNRNLDKNKNLSEYLKFVGCKSINKKVSNGLTCQAQPWLFMNNKTKDCLYRGCGYSPYTSPEGEDWARLQ